MAAISEFVQELREEARRRWYYVAIIFGSVGAMVGAAMLIEVTL